MKVHVIDGATHNFGLTPINDDGEQFIDVMIPKMTEVPCEVTQPYGTVEDDQRAMLIEVVQDLEQGLLKKDISDFDEKHKIGECILEGIPPDQPKGYPVNVTYKYNLDQTLDVKAEGKNGEVVHAKIQRKTLNEEEAKEATQHVQALKVV